MNESQVEKIGVVDTKHYSDLKNRAWTFATAGYGNHELDWKKFLIALRITGYDFVLSIEHEDACMSRKEGFEKGLSFLKSIIPCEETEKMWWA